MSLTQRPLPALLALAAQLRLGTLAFVAEVMAALGAGRLAAALRRRMAGDIARLETFATGIVVLMAFKRLPPPPEARPAPRRPRGAPRGFALVDARDDAMRAMRRNLFPLDRDLARRLRRLDAVLDRAIGAAARLARRIARVPPAVRLIAVAPSASRLASLTGDVGPAPSDTS